MVLSPFSKNVKINNEETCLKLVKQEQPQAKLLLHEKHVQYYSGT